VRGRFAVQEDLPLVDGVTLQETPAEVMEKYFGPDEVESIVGDLEAADAGDLDKADEADEVELSAAD